MRFKENTPGGLLDVRRAIRLLTTCDRLTNEICDLLAKVNVVCRHTENLSSEMRVVVIAVRYRITLFQH